MYLELCVKDCFHYFLNHSNKKIVLSFSSDCFTMGQNVHYTRSGRCKRSTINSSTSNNTTTSPSFTPPLLSLYYIYTHYIHIYTHIVHCVIPNSLLLLHSLHILCFHTALKLKKWLPFFKGLEQQLYHHQLLLIPRNSSFLLLLPVFSQVLLWFLIFFTQFRIFIINLIWVLMMFVYFEYLNDNSEERKCLYG